MPDQSRLDCLQQELDLCRARVSELEGQLAAARVSGAAERAEAEARAEEADARFNDAVLERDQDRQRRRDRRQARDQRTQEALERLSPDGTLVVTSRSFGLYILRDAAPAAFEAMTAQYGDILDAALDARVFGSQPGLRADLRRVADRLGFNHAGPRDVVDLHLTAMRSKVEGVREAKARAYRDEGRMVLLELMGYLVSYYRSYFVRALQGDGAPREETNP